MKTSELKGAALDWAVAKAMGGENLYWDDENLCFVDGFDVEFRPSVCWEHGGPIIERLGISTTKVKAIKSWHWVAGFAFPSKNPAYGTTPLIAAMRCYVASKLGDEIELPEGLA